MKSTTLEKFSFQYAFCLFFETSKSMKISLILNNIAAWFKVGDLSGTVSESLRDFFTKVGDSRNPAA